MPVPVEIGVSVGRLPAAVEATAYFVVAEALTNVAKHARAERAEVTARVEDGTLVVQVRDDGVGGARPDGSGLIGLADRLAALDGRLRVESPVRRRHPRRRHHPPTRVRSLHGVVARRSYGAGRRSSSRRPADDKRPRTHDPLQTPMRGPAMTTIEQTAIREEVRDGIARGIAAIGLAGVALIHLLDLPGKLSETPYMFFLYVALMVSSVALAGALIRTDDTRVWAAVAVLPALVIVGYVLSRTTGLPQSSDDIGNWSEPLGMASLFVEGSLVALASAVLFARCDERRGARIRRTTDPRQPCVVIAQRGFGGCPRRAARPWPVSTCSSPGGRRMARPLTRRRRPPWHQRP